MKKILAILVAIFFGVAGIAWAGPQVSGGGGGFVGTESTTGSAGSLKSPATTGVTTITGPTAGHTRNITIPDADLTIGTLTDTKVCLGTATGFNCNNSTLSITSITGTAIVPAEVDGHTDQTSLTAAQVSDTVITNQGQADADVFLLLPTAAAGYSFLATVATAQAKHFGVEAGANDKIYLIAADGTIAAGNDAAGVVMTAAQVGQQFACWTFKTGASAYDWACKAIAIGTSTFAAHAHSTP